MIKDNELWEIYAKGVRKVRKIKKIESPSRLREGLGAGGELATLRHLPHSEPFRKMSPVSPPPSPPASRRGALKENTFHKNLDRRIEKNLRQGDIKLDARIDLHGMTQTEAYDQLAKFLAQQVKAGKRNLLIITGKGRNNEGILRSNLPHWLHSLPEASQILSLRPAAPKHGGTGAFYVLLKKKKIQS